MYVVDDFVDLTEAETEADTSGDEEEVIYIKTVKKRKTKKRKSENRDPDTEEPICSICFCAINEKPFSSPIRGGLRGGYNNDASRRSPIPLKRNRRCVHVFHAECLEKWLNTRDQESGLFHSSCPNCRAKWSDRKLPMAPRHRSTMRTVGWNPTWDPTIVRNLFNVTEDDWM